MPFIPRAARVMGAVRCFAYHGLSMVPTFRPGHLLYVRPSAHEIRPGDVVVFADRSGKGFTTHRVVRCTPEGLVTRGDNNPSTDAVLVTLERVVGRVAMAEHRGRLRRVRGGRLGFWFARLEWAANRAVRRLKPVLGIPYRALRRSDVTRRLLLGPLSPRVQYVLCQTPEGVLVKIVHRGAVVARWLPSAQRFECRKPYDLILRREDLPGNRIAEGESPGATA